MKALSLAVLISFIGLVVFSAWAMGHASGSHGFSGCLAAEAQNSQCPETNAWAEALFHLSVFKNFSTLIPANLIAVFLMIGLMGTLTQSLFKAPLRPQVQLSLWRDLQSEAAKICRHSQCDQWFSLHENSPSRFDAAARF